MNPWRQYREIQQGEFFVVGSDTSQGGNDFSATVFLSKTNLDIPLVFHSPVIATDMTNKIFPVLERIHDRTGVPPVIAYERNAGGIFEFERLAALNRANKFRIYRMKTYGAIENAEETKLGWDTNTATRPAMLSDLKDAVDKHLLTIYDKPTIAEMYAFILTRQGRPEAEVGSHDDLVMSLAIAWQLYQTEQPIVHQHFTPYNKGKWAIV